MKLAGDPTLYLFAGSNGAGKTTFARGLSPLDPIGQGSALSQEGMSKGWESMRARMALSVTILRQPFTFLARCGLIETALPASSPALAIRHIRQRVKMGGHSIPEADVRRRFPRSLDHFLEIYAPLADGWTFRNNSTQPAALLFDSANSTLQQVKDFLSQ